MYIYKLTQENVKVRKLGQDFKDFIWRGLRIHPHAPAVPLTEGYSGNSRFTQP